MCAAGANFFHQEPKQNGKKRLQVYKQIYIQKTVLAKAANRPRCAPIAVRAEPVRSLTRLASRHAPQHTLTMPALSSAAERMVLPCPTASRSSSTTPMSCCLLVKGQHIYSTSRIGFNWIQVVSRLSSWAPSIASPTRAV